MRVATAIKSVLDAILRSQPPDFLHASSFRSHSQNMELTRTNLPRLHRRDGSHLGVMGHEAEMGQNMREPYESRKVGIFFGLAFAGWAKLTSECN